MTRAHFLPDEETVETSRIEAANRVLDTSFIISEDVYLVVSDHIDARPLRPIGLRGKTGQFVLYQVLHPKKVE